MYDMYVCMLRAYVMLLRYVGVVMYVCMLCMYVTIR